MTFKRRRSHKYWKKCGQLVLLTLVLFPAWAEPMVVFLKNGDRLTGEITSENPRRIVLKNAITGRVTIPRDQVDRVISVAALAAAAAAATNAPAATETAQPAAVAAATPPPSPAPPPAVAAPPSAAATPPTSQTNAPTVVEPWLPGWLSGSWTNWHGSVQFGANVGVGTTDRHAVLVNASASKKWGRTTSILNYNLNYGVVNEVVNANKMAGDTKIDVELNKNRNFYTYGQGGAGYDDIRKINLEYLIGGGMGYKFLNRPNLVLAGELGGQYQVFDYFTSPDKENVAVKLGENLTTKLGKNVTLTQRFGFTPGIEDPSDYQVRFGLTLGLPLFKPLTLNLNITEEYYSLPAPGVSNNDLQVSTTLGVNF